MELIQIGKIVRPHGYKGDFVTLVDTGPDSALRYLKNIHIGTTPETTSPFDVVEANWMPRGWKIRVAGILSDTQVKSHVGQFVYAKRSELEPPAPGEYYLADLQGCEARERETGTIIGTFRGADESWWFDTLDGEVSIPNTKRFIDEVDLPQRTIWIKNYRELS